MDLGDMLDKAKDAAKDVSDEQTEQARDAVDDKVDDSFDGALRVSTGDLGLLAQLRPDGASLQEGQRIRGQRLFCGTPHPTTPQGTLSMKPRWTRGRHPIARRPVAGASPPEPGFRNWWAVHAPSPKGVSQTWQRSAIIVHSALSAAS